MSQMERRDTYIDLSEKISRIEVNIAKGFAEAMGKHSEINKDILEMKDVQEKILHTLYGNGKEGLQTTVAKLVNKINVIQSAATLVLGIFVYKLLGMNLGDILSLFHP